jgi:hypothetical protein
MTVTIEGTRWKVPDAAELVREHFSKPPASRQLFVLGCDQCKSLCAVAMPCDCCKNFGKYFGGKRVRTTTPHSFKFPKEQIVACLQEKLAA